MVGQYSKMVLSRNEYPMQAIDSLLWETVLNHQIISPRRSNLIKECYTTLLLGFSSVKEVTVSVIFKTNATELIRGGHVVAKHGCWTQLKGGIVANYSSPAEILFETKNSKLEIWADSVSLQPFTKEQWRSHQDESIERVRKSKTTFTNAMKWYSTEEIQGQENYTIADAMMDFTKENDISVRGHNIFWDNENMQPKWVKSLSSDELREAIETRINSVLDPKPLLFMNEYNTIEYSGDRASCPANYIAKMAKIRSFPGNEGISAAIGLQGHFTAGQPNLTYMRAALDAFDTTSLPIWLTEVSVDSDPNQVFLMFKI
ncbi:uncharacterized protein DS421_9g279250 [Arachis hypogaea]|nr:uncharacterized protein DS421_9g279250 [Arachis hypogaea]